MKSKTPHVFTFGMGKLLKAAARSDRAASAAAAPAEAGAAPAAAQETQSLQLPTFRHIIAVLYLVKSNPRHRSITRKDTNVQELMCNTKN